MPHPRRRRRTVHPIVLQSITLLTLIVPAQAENPADSARQADKRLTFQTNAAWSPRTAIESDVAIVYGIDPTLPARLQTWREHGYRAQVMTGVSWGHYEDYLHGRWDGIDHTDQRQTDKDGKPLQHGLGGDVWYMSPGKEYGNYLAQGVKRALDAGAESIYLEEPEFWVRSGYGPNFRSEWKAFYGQAWRPPHESVDNQYRASKLKYFLYRRALEQIFQFVKQYGKDHCRRDIPCYVPTHSLLNYAHWRIVSPESSLLDVGCDGYIAQVWTGTARTPNVYRGVAKSRTFETAFLEYGAMQNLVRASGRKVWYLNDPIEDNLNRSWTDYRANWESTLVASMLQPEVWRFEVMPWPERVFNGRYPATDPAKPVTQAMPLPESVVGQRVGIPPAYETELQAVIHAMGELKQPPAQVRWEACGTQGIGVLVSDTMMFQRGEPSPSDPSLGSFYGLAMPLLKRSMPIEPVQIESAGAPGFLDRYKVLLLTYEGQKPPTASFHDALARWVKTGGALVVVDDDSDPYNAVQEWWNTPPRSYKTPRHHLFETLGLPLDATGLHRVGQGMVFYQNASPAGLTHEKDGAQHVCEWTRQACQAVGLPWRQSSGLALRRGPYVIAAGLDELPSDVAPVVLRGRFLSLFDSQLRVIPEVELKPGLRTMLLDVEQAIAAQNPGVLAAACAIRDQTIAPGIIRFRATGVAGSRAVVCLATQSKPRGITVDHQPLKESASHFNEGLLWIEFENSPTGVDVQIDL
jgi:hypothetical protein